MIQILFLMLSLSFSDHSTDPHAYLGLDKPGVKPVIFAPGLISRPGIYEYGSVFSKNGLEFYYGVALENRAEIRFTVFKDGKWTKPATLVSHIEYGYNDPFLSPDETRLYFITNQPPSGQGPAKQDYDILYVEREGQKWSSPKSPGPAINTDFNEYYMSFTNEGTMYFSSNRLAKDGEGDNFDIFTSFWASGKFQEPIRLGNAVNTSDYEADVYVAPDASYLIFCAIRKDGLGRGDLYISFKADDGTWKQAVHMGPEINTKGHELCPFVSVDGRFFFYTSNQDIYWADAAILESYRRR